MFNRTVREQDAVIDADAIGRGEGGGGEIERQEPDAEWNLVAL